MINLSQLPADKIQMMIAMCRKSFKFYCAMIEPDYPNTPLHNDLCDRLQAMSEGKNNKLIINMPPGRWKSRITSQLFPSWLLGIDDGIRLIMATYGQELANRNSRNTLNLMKYPIYGVVFPDIKLVSENVGERTTTKGGMYKAVGIGGGITGYRGHYIIIDDPIKDRQDAESSTIRNNLYDWWTSSAYTRKDGENTKFIIMCTRWHIDDLVGFVEKRDKEPRDKIIYTALDENDESRRYKEFWGVDNNSIPKLYTQGYSTRDLINTKYMIGTRDRSALYMQDPIQSTGAIFRPPFSYLEYTKTFEHAQGYRKSDIMMALFVDPAFSTNTKSCDAVVIAMGKHKITGELFIFDMKAETSAPSQTINNAIMMADKWKAYGFNIDYISIEDVTINRQQSQFLIDFKTEINLRNQQYVIHEYNPKGKKEDRIKFWLEPRISNRSLHVVMSGGELDAHRKYEEQLCKFPNGDLVDIIDCAAQGVEVRQTRGNNKNKGLDTKRTYINRATGEVVSV